MSRVIQIDENCSSPEEWVDLDDDEGGYLKWLIRKKNFEKRAILKNIPSLVVTWSFDLFLSREHMYIHTTFNLLDFYASNH